MTPPTGPQFSRTDFDGDDSDLSRAILATDPRADQLTRARAIAQDRQKYEYYIAEIVRTADKTPYARQVLGDRIQAAAAAGTPGHGER